MKVKILWKSNNENFNEKKSKVFVTDILSQQNGYYLNGTTRTHSKEQKHVYIILINRFNDCRKLQFKQR